MKLQAIMSLLYNHNSSALPRVCVGGGECQKYVITECNTTDITHSDTCIRYEKRFGDRVAKSSWNVSLENCIFKARGQSGLAKHYVH